MEPTSVEKIYFSACYIAGRKYWQADEAWRLLHIGSVLEMHPEPDNSHDPWAVALYFNSGDNIYKLGYIPKGKNRTIHALLLMGWQEVFECRVSRLDPMADYDSQIGITVSILNTRNSSAE